jgi:dTDP-3-amino-3,4,6-trideoxy-alpha-D-glucose transaminase
VAASYLQGLQETEVRVPEVAPDAQPVWHQFVVRSADRDGLRQALTAAGVETLIHYPVPIPRQPALASQRPAECPVADRVCAEVFSLPLYPSLDSAAIARATDAIAAWREAPAGATRSAAP